MEITYDQGSEFICHEFIKYLIEEEYGITAKPSTLGTYYQVLGNLVRNNKNKDTYVDEGDPWSGILSVETFVMISTSNMLKGYGQIQLLFSVEYTTFTVVNQLNPIGAMKIFSKPN